MRHFIIAILLLASPCLHAQNQPTFEQALHAAQNGNQEASNWLKKAADKGDTKAYGDLGRYYFEIQNYQEAIKWLKKAADRGDTNAYSGLGRCYLEIQNYQEASKWLKKAVDKGDTKAYKGLGLYYILQQNYQEAINWLKKAADKGDTNAYGGLGRCYVQLQNYQEAINWLKKAIDKGDSDAYGDLGYCYLEIQNYQEAINWLKKAIDKGDSNAYGNLGYCYVQLQNYQEAINWLKKAIDKGDSNAYGDLGYSYAQLQNYQEAIKWLKKAAGKGDAKAYSWLGGCYAQLQNYQEATIWLKKAADKGDAKAYSGLGVCYYQLQNYQEAINWFKKAADNGETLAYVWIGESYSQRQNYQEAVTWYKKAIDNGDTQTYGRLGYCYYQLQNYQEAIIWLKKAADKEEIPAYAWIGESYLQLQNYQEAIIWLKKSIENGDIQAPLDICHAYYMVNNYVEAKKWANTIINQKVNASFGYRVLSLLNMYGLGVPKNKDKAFEFIAKAIDAAKQEGGSMPNTLDVEGELYLANNNISKAREIYNDILKETPDFYTQKETKLSKFMKEHKGGDVDFDIPIADNVSNHTFAVIISNEKYQMEKFVQYAENDGKAFTEYCKKTLGLPEKNVHFVTNATLNNIKHEIKWLQDVITVYNGDAKIIFYYAGHGIPDEQNKSAYLLPIDGYGSDVTTGYALEDLYKALGSLPSKSVTVFLDACFSGAKRDGEMLASARGVAIKVKQATPVGNIVVFSAAQGDETAYSYKEEEHGLFTYYLLKKLQETKGNVTLGELSDYIKTQVERQSIVINGKLQSPSFVSTATIANSWKKWTLK